ncbi:MAG: PaaI family thioesterase [Desulfobulbaceae bacterium]|jgi:hypothetical protein|nr:PaaI family thioesterase [Desulfobulbaceae bacterium]
MPSERTAHATSRRGDDDRAESPVDVTPEHAHCFICGDFHPGSWGLSFAKTEDGGVETKFAVGSELQGYDNIVHGGVIATLLDAAMTHCLFHRGIQAVTGDLRVRFLHPVCCDTTMEIRAWLLFSCPPLYQLKGEITFEGLVMAKAEGKFMKREKDDAA